VATKDPKMKQGIRDAAEVKKIIVVVSSDEWLADLRQLGKGPNKPHITVAPWPIIIFAQRYDLHKDSRRYKHYRVSESAGIASGILTTALNHCSLNTLIQTPNPMSFLNGLCERPKKPFMTLPIE